MGGRSRPSRRLSPPMYRSPRGPSGARAGRLPLFDRPIPGRRDRYERRTRRAGGVAGGRSARDELSRTLTPVTARHPLQPKDWKSGSHAARFERVRPYLEHRTVLDVGAGSGINRPDWMHAAVAGAAAEAVGVELDPELAARARD